MGCIRSVGVYLFFGVGVYMVFAGARRLDGFPQALGYATAEANATIFIGVVFIAVALVSNFWRR